MQTLMYCNVELSCRFDGPRQLLSIYQSMAYSSRANGKQIVTPDCQLLMLDLPLAKRLEYHDGCVIRLQSTVSQAKRCWEHKPHY